MNATTFAQSSPVRYSPGVAGETKSETINAKVTPHVKRLALGAVRSEGLGSEGNLISEAIREYCRRRKIAPISEEELEAHKASSSRKSS